MKKESCISGSGKDSEGVMQYQLTKDFIIIASCFL